MGSKNIIAIGDLHVNQIGCLLHPKDNYKL